MDDDKPATIELNPVAQIAEVARSVTEIWKDDTRRKPGRPTLKSEDLIEEICLRLACGESFRVIAKDDHMPNYDTLKEWRMKDADFKDRTNEAYEELAHTYREMHFDILTGALPLPSHQDRKNAADGIKWQAAKLNRVDYGEKIDLTSNGNALPAVILPTIALPNFPIEAEFDEVVEIGDHSGDD
jgi:hypothetical protein